MPGLAEFSCVGSAHLGCNVLEKDSDVGDGLLNISIVGGNLAMGGRS